MPSVNFYLKKPPGKIPYALIYLQFKYNGRKLVYSFGQKINPPDWSKQTKRVRSNRQTILDGRYAINEQLDKLEKACLRIYQEELVNGIPQVAVLKYRLDAFIRQNESRKKQPPWSQLIDRFISGEIKHKGKDKSRNTLKNYKTTKTHLEKFDIATRYHIDFEKINLDFFHRYTVYLKEDLKLKPNSIARDIGVVKTLMNEAVDLGYTSNIQFRHKKFSFAGAPADTVSLTEKEITRLYRFNCSEDKRLERVRDLFVNNCFSNDYTKTRASFATQAPAHASIPIPDPHPFVTEIRAKYQDLPGHLPKSPSNQKFNQYIKEVCRLAGLVEKGRLSAEPDRELWECISSRTATRSRSKIISTRRLTA